MFCVPDAVNCVADPKVVFSAVLPIITVAPLTKFLPLTVSEKFPAVAEAGLIPVNVGVGFNSATALVPFAVLSALLVAVTVTEFPAGSVPGAE